MVVRFLISRKKTLKYWIVWNIRCCFFFVLHSNHSILSWSLDHSENLVFVLSVIGSISIKVEPALIEYGKSGVNISCIVNGTNIISISSIQLKRSESNVVSVTKVTSSFWQDKKLEKKAGVTVNASISNVMSSYLHLEIPSSAVRYPEEMGSYQCILSVVNSNGGVDRCDSQSIMLNITSIKKTMITFNLDNFALALCDHPDLHFRRKLILKNLTARTKTL